MTPNPKLILGTDVKIGLNTVTVPPLNIGAFRALKTEFEIVGAPQTDQGLQFDAMMKIIRASIARNYSNVTLDELEETLDLGNMRVVFQAVMGISGLKPSGEASPAAN